MTISNQYQYPWEIPLPLTKRISRKLRKLTGRNAFFKISTNTIEIPPDMASTFFDNGEYYERNVTYWLEKILLGTKNRVFYDIGANYGYYCLKLIENSSYIYAFEPVSRTYDMLLKNIRRNNLTNITAYKLGLSDQRSSRKIYLYSTSGKNTLFLRSTWDLLIDPLIGQEVIDLVTLDDLIQDDKLNPPDLIKIDIEGGELYALRGARQTIKEFQPVLVIEYLEVLFNGAGYSRCDLLKELMDSNYTIYGIPRDIDDLNVYPMAEFDTIEIENILVMPKRMEHLIGDAAH